MPTTRRSTPSRSWPRTPGTAAWSSGAPVTAWRQLDLETAVTRAWVNDQPAGQGKTGDALGHPLEAVAWLANLLNGRGRMLDRGMIVMTGSSITTKFPAPGDRVRFAIDGLGEISLEATG